MNQELTNVLDAWQKLSEQVKSLPSEKEATTIEQEVRISQIQSNLDLTRHE